MTDIDCESVRVAAMALRDGEASPLGTEEIEAHLSQCELCTEEMESLLNIDKVLNSQKRVSIQADVWPMVSERLESKAASASFRWRVLLLFGIPLFGYKGLLLLLQTAPSLWSKLVPVLLVIGIFTYLRTNPFKINSELKLSGEFSS
jgi:hypothetical protein